MKKRNKFMLKKYRELLKSSKWCIILAGLLLLSSCFESTDQGEVSPKRSMFVYGKVLDCDNLTIDQAEISILNRKSGKVISKVKTDINGEFNLEILYDDSTYTITVKKQHYLSFSRVFELSLDHNDLEVNNIILERGLILLGHISDRYTSTSLSDVEIEYDSIPAKNIMIEKTDSDGYFTVSGLLENRKYSFKFRKTGYAKESIVIPSDAIKSNKPYEVLMEKGAVVRGKLIDRNTRLAVKGAEVYVKNGGTVKRGNVDGLRDSIYTYVGVSQGEAFGCKTDDNGCFEIVGVKDGTYYFDVIVDHYGILPDLPDLQIINHIDINDIEIEIDCSKDE